MTREEAKDVFLNRGYVEVENCRGRIFNADKWREACIVISEWLKEEPILDKIRAEIFNACSDSYHMPVYKLSCEEIFEIIDKYKVEGSEKE